MISFIISAYNRPIHLACCAASLEAQSEHNERLVVDNGLRDGKHIAALFSCKYIDTSATHAGNCYHDPATILPHVSGEWLCWPSDDSYYVPAFSRIMLKAAADNGWDFVYCDAVYNNMDGHGKAVDAYEVLRVRPECGGIDKTMFILKREWWERIGGWPQHESDWRDGALAEALVKAGCPHGKAPGVLLFHN